MKKLLIQTLCIAVILSQVSCKKQLDIGNPNAPTFAGNVTNEVGITALAKGAIYVNGLANGDGWLGDSYFSLPWGYNELMADNVGAEASNNQVTTIGVADYFIANGVKKTNPSPTVGIIRAYNNRASTGANNNPIYYMWLNMYSMINSCNQVLVQAEEIPYAGDAATKLKTIQAWCHFWKGFAYASIGTTYYSGLIIEDATEGSDEYVLHDKILEASAASFQKAEDLLAGITNLGDYESILAKLIPSFNLVGNGGLLSPAMWIRNINTMRARNILLNKLAPFVNDNPAASISKSSTSNMTPGDWSAVLTLVQNGVKSGDKVFTGRAPAVNGFFSYTGGTVPALIAVLNTNSTFKITERFMQYFKPADKRLANNFDQSTTFKNNYLTTTRWNMLDGGKGMAGVYVYADRDPDQQEVLIAGSYEENELMLAEANIRLGNIEEGLGHIDIVRNYFGAGLPAVKGTGLALVAAMKELVAERRVAMGFHGVSFFDNRRWGWTYDVSVGGGSYGNIVANSDGTVDTGVLISYNFMDYWDIPADEIELNPPSETSAATKNPNF